jgi:hypothetical protein
LECGKLKLYVHLFLIANEKEDGMNFVTIHRNTAISLAFFVCLTFFLVSALAVGWSGLVIAACPVKEPGNQFGVDPILSDMEVVAIAQEEIDAIRKEYHGRQGFFMNEWGILVGPGIKHSGRIDGYPTPVHYWLKTNSRVRGKVESAAAELRRRLQELPLTWHWSAVCQKGKYKGSYTGQWVISKQDAAGNVSGKFAGGHTGYFEGSITRSRVHFLRTFKRNGTRKQEWFGILSLVSKSGKTGLKISGTFTDPAVPGGCSFNAWANCNERSK